MRTKKRFYIFCLLLVATLIPIAPAKASGSNIKKLLGKTEIQPDTYYLIEYNEKESVIKEGTEKEHNLFFKSSENTLYTGSPDNSLDMAYHTQSDIGLTLPDDSDITIY